MAKLDINELKRCAREYYGVELISFTPSVRGINGARGISGNFIGYGPDVITGDGSNNQLMVTNEVGYTGMQIAASVNETKYQDGITIRGWAWSPLGKVGPERAPTFFISLASDNRNLWLARRQF
jgi:hypothetical protein